MTTRQRKADLAWERACVATIRREYAGFLVATLRAVLEKRKAENREKAFEALFDSMFVQGNLEAKSDADIADLLEEHVWADMNILSPQSDLVAEAIVRLRARAGATT